MPTFYIIYIDKFNLIQKTQAYKTNSYSAILVSSYMRDFDQTETVFNQPFELITYGT